MSIKRLMWTFLSVLPSLYFVSTKGVLSLLQWSPPGPDVVVYDISLRVSELWTIHFRLWSCVWCECHCKYQSLLRTSTVHTWYNSTTKRNTSKMHGIVCIVHVHSARVVGLCSNGVYIISFSVHIIYIMWYVMHRCESSKCEYRSGLCRNSELGACLLLCRPPQYIEL